VKGILLLPLAWVYGAAVWLRNWCYDRKLFAVERVPVPVIAVGNLTAGGNGKTPFTEYLVRYFLAKGKKVAVVSRGYRRMTKGCVTVSDGSGVVADVRDAGDEPWQIAKKFSGAVVIVDEEKARGARMAHERYGAGMILLDDGFQHRKLHRDLDIVMVDGGRRLKYERLLPAGRRREQLSSLRRADLVVFTHKWPAEGWTGERHRDRIDLPSIRMQLVPRRLVRLSDRAELPLEVLFRAPCVCFAGIAQPGNFLWTLMARGAEIKKSFVFPDHHWFTDAELDSVAAASAEVSARYIVTTEKDAVRLDRHPGMASLHPEKTVALIVEAEISDPAGDLEKALDRISAGSGL
jgi:tetraacyldisaccharide 4'-kinase